MKVKRLKMNSFRGIGELMLEFHSSITRDEDVLTRSLSNLNGMMYIGTHWRLLSLNAKKYSIH